MTDDPTVTMAPADLVVCPTCFAAIPKTKVADHNAAAHPEGGGLNPDVPITLTTSDGVEHTGANLGEAMAAVDAHLNPPDDDTEPTSEA